MTDICTQIGLALAIGALAWSQPPADPAPIFLPLAPAGGSWSAPRPIPRVTASPTDSLEPSATPSPVASASATVATPAHEVIVQIADFGGLYSPPYFQHRVHQAPWLTIYADGTYVRSPDLVVHDPVGGRLTPGQLRAVLDGLTIEGAFFDYPSEDRFNRCVTDGPDTYVFVRDAGREHLVASYLMLWLGTYPQRCPPGSPGMPIGPATDAFFALARQVAALNTQLAATEELFRIEHGTVFVGEPPPDEPIVVWPLTQSIAATAGADTLSAAEYAILADAIKRNRVFRDAAGTAAVGLRVEVAGWNTYCQGFAWCSP